MNMKYGAEAKKDPEKEVKFMYSKYSMVAECID